MPRCARRSARHCSSTSRPHRPKRSTIEPGTQHISELETDAPIAIETLSDADFKAELTLVIPQLRAFGRSLSGNRDTADDLVQETLMKAWSARLRFQAGTNMRAWTFIILRNIYLSQMRRTRFTGNWDDLVADRILITGPNQTGQLELADVQRGLQTLPDAQREALILVGAGGFSYEEAAEICGVAVGTIKSRVARGRVALEAVLADNSLPSRRDGPSDGNALETIIGQVRDLSGRDPEL